MAALGLGSFMASSSSHPLNVVLPQSPALCSLRSMRSFCFNAHLTFMQLRANRGADKTGTDAHPAATLKKFLDLSKPQLSAQQKFLLPTLLQ